MKLSFSSDIGFMRRFRSFKQTYADRHVVYFYLGQPFVVFFANAGKSAFVGARSLILRVFGICNRTKISYAVVRAVAVYMINLLCGPLSVNIQPRQTMRCVQRVVQSDSDVAMPHSTPSHRTFSAPAPRDGPRKSPGFWVVIKKRAQSICRQIHIGLLNTTVNINPAVCKGQA